MVCSRFTKGRTNSGGGGTVPTPVLNGDLSALKVRPTRPEGAAASSLVRGEIVDETASRYATRVVLLRSGAQVVAGTQVIDVPQGFEFARSI